MKYQYRDRPRIHRMTIAVVALAVCLTPVRGTAADRDEQQRSDFANPILTSDWQVTLGGNLTTFNTAAAWAPKGLAGAVIDLEDVLGLDEQTSTFAVAVQYRFNKRHSISLAATELDRTATRSIGGEVEWGDYIFRAEATVATDLTTRLFKLTWRYDFSDMDRLNAGFLLGLSTFDIGLTLSGEARLETNSGDQWVEGVVEGASAVAPVPVVGFFLDYALSPRWVLRFGADVIDLSISTYQGRVLETDFSFEYAVTDWFGVGAGFGGTDIDFRSEEDDDAFAVRYQFNYLGAYASFSF